ncbi:MAG: hypothetical protein HKN82_16240 [Akkermansiaceae bacterium]|nr:hypothetical protein [Akkermansiaceae bacterium]
MRQTKSARARTAAAAAVASAILATGAAHADKDWWDSTRYYEEDGWLDITEWFDGNDYNPTDESAFRWDDETYDRSEDTGSDIDSDWPYPYASDFEPERIGSLYNDETAERIRERREDMREDRGETRAKLERKARKENRRGTTAKTGGEADRQYGYDTRYGGDNWFYDYWDDGYAFYGDWDQDGTYNFSYSWFDHDGDGDYDAYYAFYDEDDDGIYDHIDTATFDGGVIRNGRTFAADRTGDARERRVAGQVVDTKRVAVRDTKHLVAMVRKDDGDTCLVDLGPSGRIGRLDVSENSRLEVRGPFVTVGDKQLLVAQRATVDGKSTAIERERQTVQGEVAGTRTVTRTGRPHLVAIVATGKDKKILADLGPAKEIDAELETGDRIEVCGAPVKVGDRRVIMACELRHDGRKVHINRAERTKEARAGKNDRSIAGTVLRREKMSVRGSERLTVTVEDRNDRQLLVDLGPVSERRFPVRQGDRIKASGPLVKTGSGKPVMLARTVALGGRPAADGDSGIRRGDRGKHEVTGDVVSTRTIDVRDQQRQLARLETAEGRTITVDLGPPRSLDSRLRAGDELTVRGVAVKSGSEVVLMAEEAEHNGGDPVVIREGKSPREPATR